MKITDEVIDELTSVLINGGPKQFLNQLERYVNQAYAKEQENKNSEKNDNSLTSFTKEFLPGRIVELDIKDQRYLGFIITSVIIVYTNNKGEIKGYLNNISLPKIDNLYDIKRIFIPTSEYYQLKDYNKMKVVWNLPVKPPVIEKSISEIEKELGLAPGSLKISK